jgi:hypothetical protein
MMQVKLKAKPEEIAEIETKNAIKIFWQDILIGVDVNPSISEWQELIEEKYVHIHDDEEYWSGTAEMRLYEFIRGIAQLCRARMITKLEKISERMSRLKREFTE